MASLGNPQQPNRQHHQDQYQLENQPPPPPKHGGHQRSKSSVLRAFMGRRNHTNDTAIVPSAQNTSTSTLPYVIPQPQVTSDMQLPNFSRRPPALGEIQNNRVDGAGAPGSRSPSKQAEQSRPASRHVSPLKNYGNPLAARSTTRIDSASSSESMGQYALSNKKENESPTKPKKTKSATNLTSLLSRPKSLKNLHKLQSEDDVVRTRKDKENRTPPSSVTTPSQEGRPPIYAQFSSGALEQPGNGGVFGSGQAGSQNSSTSDVTNPAFMKKPRPQSYHVQYTAKQFENKNSSESADSMRPGYSSAKIPSPSKTQRGLKMFTSGFGGGSKPKPSSTSSQPEPSEFSLDPKDIDKHLEAMLDRRNIPENQRYKMRNLTSTIKMEFIRQDWAETKASTARPGTTDSDSSINEGQEEEVKPKKPRPRSFTFSRNSGKKSEPNSPTKKKSDGTLGRHFRTKSSESVGCDRPSSSSSGFGGGILSKIKSQQAQQGPVDFVSYLRKVQKPQQVEVGKLHKLRLLLRNETVSWTDEFVRQGGMEEIVSLLHRTMEVEWREEHEDALLHENLLCLKALCTTALALQYLHSKQSTLFPALLHLIFDPEKKGPSEFTTRGIITSVLFTYIQSAPPQDRMVRARTILGHLHDPKPKDDEAPVDFVLEMRRERPYRVWCKEAIGVTKEVFWIFLHHLNVVYLPRDKERDAAASAKIAGDSMLYMQTHFPQERPPVPAAPYVGGVEWDATNYLASHLDLLNAILACTPTTKERNELRNLFRISGWERCMGGSMRLCKEKFYPGVHDALRTWVAAAADDGWDVKDVRYGPPAESKSPVKRPAAGKDNQNKKGIKVAQPPPKIEIPKLDFAFDSHISPVSTPGGGGGFGKPPVGINNNNNSGALNWLS
ncbi:GTPase-binding protein rid1 [Apiospora arundinis]